MLPALTEPRESWLNPVGEVPGSIPSVAPGKKPAPITFVLGAGASLSSRAPGTTEILSAYRRKWPGKFPTDEAVYERFTEEIPPSDREGVVRELFESVDPYVGYRCLAAMAQSRPIFVVNLNWDNCVSLACERIGVPVRPFDLKDFAEGEKALRSIRSRGRGVACAHVHGFLDNPKKEYGIRFRFAHSETNAFAPEEFKLLKKLLAPLTIIAGTSLEGPGDVREMLKALLPDKPEKANSVWVFERGPHRPRGVFRRASSFHASLLKALVDRNSFNNYISNPDIDFDAMLAKLRGDTVGLPWEAVYKETEESLTKLAELVPPNPEVVRPLLDGNRALIVGAPRVGGSTLAYLVAWWRCLTAPGEGPLQVKGIRRPEEALKYLSKGVADEVRAIVLDDLFDERDARDEETESLRDELAVALGELDEGKAVIATASPDGTTAAMCEPPELKKSGGRRKPIRRSLLATMLTRIVVQAGTFWLRDDLRAWARARGGRQAELVCREIRMGAITTPSQAVRRYGDQTPFELEASWQKRLRSHVDNVCSHSKQKGGLRREGILLALLRLQDFSIPRAAESLASLAGVSVETVLGDPWGLCTPIRVDAELYIRLSHPGVVHVVDDWIEDNLDELAGGLAALRESGHWAVEALERWRVYRSIGDGLEVPKGFGWTDLEIFGSEFVERAMHHGRPDRALDALQRMWHCAPDHWSVKDVALDLVRHWEALQSDATRDAARNLRDEVLAADHHSGAYALLEALLRVGKPAAIELWNPVTTKLVDLANAAGESTDPLLRRQVALAFDAILWRRCPVNQDEARKFIEPLIEAAERDGLLRVAFVTATAYHFDGYKRLKDEGFEPPLINGSTVTVEQAREMAWLVAWHFVHQSRCRAVASRRMFQSTLEAFVREGAPRYLDRSRRQDPLDAEHGSAVVRLAKALASHPDTAGWGLHAIMNIHATMGDFNLPRDLRALLNEMLDRDKLDPGIISAALTYLPAESTRALLRSVFNENEDGKLALQRGLGRGVPVEVTDRGNPTWVVEPRFAMGIDPMRARERWGAGPGKLPRGNTIESLIERLAAAVDEAVAKEKVTRPAAERALARMRRGETWPIEAIPRDRNMDSRTDWIALLVSACRELGGKDGK